MQPACRSNSPAASAAVRQYSHRRTNPGQWGANEVYEFSAYGAAVPVGLVALVAEVVVLGPPAAPG
jgi:hypothetical protein